MFRGEWEIIRSVEMYVDEYNMMLYYMTSWFHSAVCPLYELAAAHSCQHRLHKNEPSCWSPVSLPRSPKSTSAIYFQNKALTLKKRPLSTRVSFYTCFHFIKTSTVDFRCYPYSPFVAWHIASMEVCVWETSNVDTDIEQTHIRKGKRGLRWIRSTSTDSRAPVTPMSIFGVSLTQNIRNPTMGCGALLGKSTSSCLSSRR